MGQTHESHKIKHQTKLHFSLLIKSKLQDNKFSRKCIKKRLSCLLTIFLRSKNCQVFRKPCPMFACYIKICPSYLLCILPSFWVLRAPESWSKYFFWAAFNLFCSFQTFFSDFTSGIKKTRLQ